MEIWVENFNRLVKYGVFVLPSQKIQYGHKSRTGFENKCWLWRLYKGNSEVVTQREFPPCEITMLSMSFPWGKQTLKNVKIKNRILLWNIKINISPRKEKKKTSTFKSFYCTGSCQFACELFHCGWKEIKTRDRCWTNRI